jgi:hypothetical protein
VKNLTKTQAMAAYRKVCKQLGTTPHPEPVTQGADSAAWAAGPVLCRDFEGWSSTTHWAIVWEGDYDWPHRMWEQFIGTKVFAEPINGYSLGLYVL